MPPKNIMPPKKKPTFEELQEFCDSKEFGYLAKKIWEYYEADSEGDYWHDMNGRLVRSWKRKLLVVWFNRDKNPRPRTEADGYGENIPEW